LRDEPFEEKRNILIVDDMLSSASLLYELIKDDYNVQIALDGHKALQLADREPRPDLVLLDIRMPDIDGYEVCRRLQENPKTREIPVIFVTALSEKEHETQGLELGGSDYIAKPINPGITRARIRHQLELKQARESLRNQKLFLEETVRERTRELILTQEVTILCMTNLAETRDNETGNHIQRTRNYIRILSQSLRQHKAHYAEELDDRVVELLHQSAMLHDIGKVGIPDSILMKPAALDKDEFEIMKNHTILGRNALLEAEKKLGSNSFLRYAREIAFTHHENWDGSGYPSGFSGTDIPLSGRLMAVADVYDALISKRVYKPPFTHSKAVEIIAEGRGTKFEPDIIDCFLKDHEQFRIAALHEVDDEEQRQALIIR
jgi:putative two-component system response regulator